MHVSQVKKDFVSNSFINTLFMSTDSIELTLDDSADS